MRLLFESKVKFISELDELADYIHPRQMNVPPEARRMFGAPPCSSTDGKEEDPEENAAVREAGGKLVAGEERGGEAAAEAGPKVMYKRGRWEGKGKVFGVDVDRAYRVNGNKVPQVVRDCIAHIEEGLVVMRGVTLRGLFTAEGEGVAAAVSQLCEAYDQGGKDTVDLMARNCDAVTASVLLMTYLRHLPEPVIPEDIRECLLGCLAIDDFGLRIQCISPLLLSLPEGRLKLLEELLGFLNCIYSLEHEQHGSGMNTFRGHLGLQELAVIFSRVIVGGEAEPPEGLPSGCTPAGLVASMITGQGMVFGGGG